MVALLSDEWLESVVQGVSRSRGLVACKIVKTNRYDHKRHRAKRNGTMLLTWDFILERDDGTCMALHPEWSRTKIWTREGIPVEDLEVPATGLGGSNGPGTYKTFKNKHLEQTMTFDATKAAAQGNTNANPKAKAKAKPMPKARATPQATPLSRRYY